ncbi:isoamylase early set domain-containing protein [Desulfurivibrio dismutans]|uniref:isoamylase early set domain-containing protein n=1 Tax=Desulfurivibrio dismutans TaxID=1398908 RepID=UPI0023DBC1A5|nr:isoamylase early set domain-containing protein [Desulfurivibrio alkaliphilus]MDF1614889.1 isoamylase early set domain-containing protein [Desulfurivibrio alkaliphilus]
MSTKASTAPKTQKKTCKSSKTCKQGTTSAGANQEFSLMAPDAAEVYVVGDFNDWKNGSDKMRKLKSGLHKKSKKLKPGRYEYRFVVDGQWLNDPACDQRCANPFGGENSVIEVR